MKYGATLARGQISETNDLGSRLRSRTLRMTFVLFWLPQTVYATALCLAMNSANDPSVIYPSVCTKAAPVAPSGLRDDLGAVPSGGGSPKSAFGQTLMENQEKWMELCALASKEQDPAKLLALTQEIARLLAEKEQRVKEIHRVMKEQEQLATSESSGFNFG